MAENGMLKIIHHLQADIIAVAPTVNNIFRMEGE